MPKGTRRGKKHALILADVPERVRLRDLVNRLEERRDHIAEQDLQIEILRSKLTDFEAIYQARLTPQKIALDRVSGVIKHLENWSSILQRDTKSTVPAQAIRLEKRRIQELEEQAVARQEAADAEYVEPALQNDPLDWQQLLPQDEELENAVESPQKRFDQRLKEAYRSLARRYHPDLARTEEERISFGETMGRINEYYRAKDVDRLEMWAEQAKGGEIDDTELEINEQIELLQERLNWFDAVHTNLKDEHRELEQTPTFELMQRFEEAAERGQNLFQELREELQRSIDAAYNDVQEAIYLIEDSVSDYNRRVSKELTPKAKGLTRKFDPLGDKQLVRLGLDHLTRAPLTQKGREYLEWAEELVDENPSLLNLLLLTYISELSPFPLEGLESFDDIAHRFDFLNRFDAERPQLNEALVEADDVVEFGVKRATVQVAHLGLRFRKDVLLSVIPEALKKLKVRRKLKDVLGVLSKEATCSSCDSSVFPVPLYRLRGLDHMRANVCPRCGHNLSSYWMPKGKDVQSVLNSTFLDFELVSEWRFALARGQVAIQLVPHQVENLSLGDLKKRLVDDLFTRYDIEIGRRHVHLQQEGKRVAEKTSLLEVTKTDFELKFTPDAPHTETEALELVRHRIRTRFST